MTTSYKIPGNLPDLEIYGCKNIVPGNVKLFLDNFKCADRIDVFFMDYEIIRAQKTTENIAQEKNITTTADIYKHINKIRELKLQYIDKINVEVQVSPSSLNVLHKRSLKNVFGEEVLKNIFPERSKGKEDWVSYGSIRCCEKNINKNIYSELADTAIKFITSLINLENYNNYIILISNYFRPTDLVEVEVFLNSMVKLLSHTIH